MHVCMYVCTRFHAAACRVEAARVDDGLMYAVLFFTYTRTYLYTYIYAYAYTHRVRLRVSKECHMM